MPRRIRPGTATRMQPGASRTAPEERGILRFPTPRRCGAATAGASLLLLDSAIGLEQPGAAGADAQLLLEVLEALAQPR